MSKTGNWLIEMQEYAQSTTKELFIKEYGETQVHIWEEVQEEAQLDFEQSERNLEQFQDAQGEMALEDCIKIEGGY